MAKFKKTLSNWLNARHNLIIQNEENFSEKATYKFTYAKIVFFGFLIFVLLMALAFYLVNTVLKEWFDPRFTGQQNRIELVEMRQSLDSLEIELNERDNYIQNIKRILTGESEQPVDEMAKTQIRDEEPNEAYAQIDSSFKSEFETGGDFLLSAMSENLELREVYFFSPINGYNISAPFDPLNEHFGIDVLSKKDEPVKTIADGTVIFADWTQNDGYVIAVQHSQNLISVYKHNSSLIKGSGAIVSAGEILAIIGNTGERTSGPHLHFELWYDGAPVNPEEFISF